MKLKNVANYKLSPRSLNTILALREFGFYLAEPLDLGIRALNGKADLPPLHLRKHVGPLRGFEASGAEFTAYLKLIAELKPDQRMLDIGCGCGLLALNLKDYFTSGSYTGVDIHKPSIAWCQKNIGSKYANFHFHHLDVKNPVYNPQGTLAVETLVFPFEAGSADVILLKSVFTHMLSAGLDNYLKEISRLLSEGGRCLATFFLLNDEQGDLLSEGRSALRFEFGDDTCRYEYQHSPERVVGFKESYVCELLEKHNLHLRSTLYGGWSGREKHLSHQDILVIEKRAPST